VRKIVVLVAVCGVLLGSSVAQATSFIPEDHLCAMRYMIVVKNMQEGHPQRKDYEVRFYKSLDHFGEKFPEVEHEDMVREISSGAQSLYNQIAQGAVTPDSFWDDVIICDGEYGFAKTVKP